MMDLLAYGAIIWAAVPATAIPLVYGLKAPWWRSHLGRALMLKAVGIMLLIDLSLLFSVLGPDYPGRDAVRVVVFLLISGGLTYQCWALLDIIRETERTPQPTAEEINEDDGRMGAR